MMRREKVPRRDVITSFVILMLRELPLQAIRDAYRTPMSGRDIPETSPGISSRAPPRVASAITLGVELL
jgi:hypothetical protein